MERKGALEMSVSTIVILVIGMTMLILGIVLVTNIFTGATDSVDDLNEKVKNEISSLFSDTNKDVIVKLGADNTAKITPGPDAFGIAIGAKTKDGSATNRERLKYKLTPETATGSNCASPRILGQTNMEKLFVTPLNVDRSFDEYDGATAFAIIELKVPKGTAECTQKIFIDVKDTQTTENVGGSFFIIDISSGGFF